MFTYPEKPLLSELTGNNLLYSHVEQKVKENYLLILKQNILNIINVASKTKLALIKKESSFLFVDKRIGELREQHYRLLTEVNNQFLSINIVGTQVSIGRKAAILKNVLFLFIENNPIEKHSFSSFLLINMFDLADVAKNLESILLQVTPELANELLRSVTASALDLRHVANDFSNHSHRLTNLIFLSEQPSIIKHCNFKKKTLEKIIAQYKNEDLNQYITEKFVEAFNLFDKIGGIIRDEFIKKLKKGEPVNYYITRLSSELPVIEYSSIKETIEHDLTSPDMQESKYNLFINNLFQRINNECANELTSDSDSTHFAKSRKTPYYLMFFYRDRIFNLMQIIHSEFFRHNNLAIKDKVCFILGFNSRNLSNIAPNKIFPLIRTANLLLTFDNLLPDYIKEQYIQAIAKQLFQRITLTIIKKEKIGLINNLAIQLIRAEAHKTIMNNIGRKINKIFQIKYKCNVFDFLKMEHIEIPLLKKLFHEIEPPSDMVEAETKQNHEKYYNQNLPQQNFIDASLNQFENIDDMRAMYDRSPSLFYCYFSYHMSKLDLTHHSNLIGFLQSLLRDNDGEILKSSLKMFVLHINNTDICLNIMKNIILITRGYENIYFKFCLENNLLKEPKTTLLKSSKNSYKFEIYHYLFNHNFEVLNQLISFMVDLDNTEKDLVSTSPFPKKLKVITNNYFPISHLDHVTNFLITLFLHYNDGGFHLGHVIKLVNQNSIEERFLQAILNSFKSNNQTSRYGFWSSQDSESESDVPLGNITVLEILVEKLKSFYQFQSIMLLNHRQQLLFSKCTILDLCLVLFKYREAILEYDDFRTHVLLLSKIMNSDSEISQHVIHDFLTVRDISPDDWNDFIVDQISYLDKNGVWEQLDIVPIMGRDESKLSLVNLICSEEPESTLQNRQVTARI